MSTPQTEDDFKTNSYDLINNIFADYETIKASANNNECDKHYGSSSSTSNNGYPNF